MHIAEFAAITPSASEFGRRLTVSFEFRCSRLGQSEVEQFHPE
jgi:hypothetical protein